MAKIITVPNPLLGKKSEPLVVGKEGQELVKQLKESLIQNEGVKGVGLSAIQIGIAKSAFLAYSSKSKKFITFINPEIVWYSKRLTRGIPESQNKYEGCLSVPGIWAIIRRSSVIKIKYQTEKGTYQVRKFTGFTATVIQHEYDHTRGILFTQRALEQKSPLYELKKDENDKEILKELKV